MHPERIIRGEKAAMRQHILGSLLALVCLTLTAGGAGAQTAGTQKWAFPTGSTVSDSPAVGADDTIYVGSFGYGGKLYAVNPDGSWKWDFTTGGAVDSSPAVGADGTIYLGSGDGKLYAIYGDSPGLANSTWPMFHHDLRHTGFSNVFIPFLGSILTLLMGG